MRRASSRSSQACLTATTFGNLRQLGERLDADEVHDAGRDVVVDDRLVRHGGDRLDVLDDPARRRLVVVRRHDEEAVDAELVRLLRQVDGVARVIGPGSGDDGRPVADGVQCGLVEREALVVGECRRLAGRPRDDEPVGAVVDEVGRQLAELRDADGAVGVERRHAGGQDLAQHASILLRALGLSSAAELKARVVVVELPAAVGLARPAARLRPGGRRLFGDGRQGSAACDRDRRRGHERDGQPFQSASRNATAASSPKTAKTTCSSDDGS